MKANVGTIDRVVRIVAGLAVMGAGYYYQSWFGAIGLIFVVTGLLAWCPLYLPLGLKTNGK